MGEDKTIPKGAHQLFIGQHLLSSRGLDGSGANHAENQVRVRSACDHCRGKCTSSRAEEKREDKTMKAVAVFPKTKEIKVIDRDVPQISAPDQVKLRMLD